MILFAATTPAVRYRAINAGLQTLDWAHDPQINNYGMNISLDMITTVARLLPPPAIEFGNGPILNPQYTGRWDLKGKKFWQANNIALTKWGVVILNHIGYNLLSVDSQSTQTNDFIRTMKVRQPTAIRFFEELVNEYRKYGGNIPAGTPAAWVVQDVHQGENTISNAIKRCLDQVAKFGT